MALYKHKQYLDDSDHGAFDELHRPDNIAPNSGIYRCEACGAEVICEKSKALPPNGHHVHTEEIGRIRWRLIVLAQPNGGIGVTVESKTLPSRSPGRELELELDEDEQ
jgi:hypothetical protein